jgi:hypothetical protein
MSIFFILKSHDACKAFFTKSHDACKASKSHDACKASKSHDVCEAFFKSHGVCEAPFYKKSRLYISICKHILDNMENTYESYMGNLIWL